MESFSLENLISGVRRGDKRALGKAITLVESKKAEHRVLADELLEALLPYTGNAVRVGITGVPGAGKSTFIESFGQLAIAKGKKVAVLAIDPSSTLTKGSILGDKTRMEELAREENAFIRPSPSSGFLGGIANATFESMLVCEAAGYDYILVETVGVGQSEILVADITDVFLYLKITGGGDELQGIKRGIMEMVDLIFINKVTEETLTKAKQTKVELMRALHFLPERERGWKIPVILGSALLKTGLAEVYERISDFIDLKIKNESFKVIRQEQAQKRFEYWVQELLLQKTKTNPEAQQAYEEHKKNTSELRANPATEAKLFVEQFFNN